MFVGVLPGTGPTRRSSCDAKSKSLARNNKTWMGYSGSNNVAGDFEGLAMAMPTPPKRSYSAWVASRALRQRRGGVSLMTESIRAWTPSETYLQDSKPISHVSFCR